MSFRETCTERTEQHRVIGHLFEDQEKANIPRITIFTRSMRQEANPW
jgi:hypothetical protein